MLTKGTFYTFGFMRIKNALLKLPKKKSRIFNLKLVKEVALLSDGSEHGLLEYMNKS